MSSILGRQIEQVLLPGMSLPEPFSMLFEWIEGNGFFVDRGKRYGMLFPEDKIRAGWTKSERAGGTDITFFAGGPFWYEPDRTDLSNRICPFAKTGAEGSMAAFWMDDLGRQRIVHLGSGSGSILCCVLADDPIDFLRLIAIGYDEICWNENFSYPPNSSPGNGGFVVHPNAEYQAWLIQKYAVTIPRTAREIVKHPSEYRDRETQDDFCRWVNTNAFGNT